MHCKVQNIFRRKIIDFCSTQWDGLWTVLFLAKNPITPSYLTKTTIHTTQRSTDSTAM